LARATSPVKTIDLLFEENGFTIDDVAERSRLPLEKVEAIALGRWTPSPAERLQLAEALGAAVDGIAWGHTMDPRNIRYRRLGLHENF
jgi:transcriptional regulator with XRE-family HTH domain